MSSSSEPSKRVLEEEEAPETPAADDEDTGAEVAPIIKLQEVAVSTGEEEENVLVDLRAKLYRFDKDGNQWKERGVGTVKLLKHKETSKVRLVMRQSKTLKICANHLVTPSISIQEHAGNDKSCVWHATDYADGELKEELFCIRFPSIENCKSFKETIEEVAESQVKTAKEKVEEADSAADLLGNLTVKESKDKEVKPEETPVTTEDKIDLTTEDKKNATAKSEDKKDATAKSEN